MSKPVDPTHFDINGVPLINEETMEDSAVLCSIIGLLLFKLNPSGRTAKFPRSILAGVNGMEIVTMVDPEEDTVSIALMTPDEVEHLRTMINTSLETDKSKWN